MSDTNKNIPIKYTARDAYFFALYQAKQRKVALRNETHPLIRKSLQREIENFEAEAKKTIPIIKGREMSKDYNKKIK